MYAWTCIVWSELVHVWPCMCIYACWKHMRAVSWYCAYTGQIKVLKWYHNASRVCAPLRLFPFSTWNLRVNLGKVVCHTKRTFNSTFFRRNCEKSQTEVLITRDLSTPRVSSLQRQLSRRGLVRSRHAGQRLLGSPKALSWKIWSGDWPWWKLLEFLELIWKS